MFYTTTNSTDPYYNLAFEEYVLTEKTEDDWLLLWQNDRTVVIGLNQNAAQEIDLEFARKNGIRIVRRTTGGGAVYHDLGNLNYSFITTEGADIKRFTDAVCRALAAMGVNAESSGRNDITVNGKKVSGAAQRIYKGRLLHHGTLLFSADLEMMAGVLRADPEKFASKSTKSIHSRVGNLRDYLPPDVSIGLFQEKIRDALTCGDCRYVELSLEELKRVDELANKKYRLWEWNFGNSPASTFQNRRRFPGGTLEVRAEIEDNRIRNIIFYGDFLARCPGDELRSALIACPFDKGHVAAVLDEYDVDAIFGGISNREILETLFP